MGNFGDGTISAFDLQHDDQVMGKLLGIDGKPITIGDLWAMTPGNDAGAGARGNLLHRRHQGRGSGTIRQSFTRANSNEFMISGMSAHLMTG